MVVRKRKKMGGLGGEKSKILLLISGIWIRCGGVLVVGVVEEKYVGRGRGSGGNVLLCWMWRWEDMVREG